ncbi:MAG: LysR family transcriptional regulator [Clostridiales bacterium]|nr:LysR family transcriptional regulator [Clostridiales bacterium]
MQDHRMETFLTLCETMNYRQAAERLHITQPAVTQHIQYLEGYYGCKLFSYDGRKLTKTEQAALLERGAHAMKYQEERLREDLRLRQAPSLSIGATKTIGEFIIAEHVSRYLAEPGNRLSVDVDNTARILERLNRGKLDFAIVEGYYSRSEYGDRPYQKEPFVGLCAQDHPLAGRTVPLDTLWTEDLLLREKGSGTREILEHFLGENNHAVTDFARVTCISNLGLLERLLVEKRGITFAYAAAGNGRLAQFFVEGWDLQREFSYVFLRDTGAEELVELFDSYRS